MLDLLLGMLGGWGGLAFGGAIVAAVGFAAWRLRAGGREAERLRQMRADMEARDTRYDIEDAVAGRSHDENRGRFAKWSG